jgi:hypothetical protein
VTTQEIAEKLVDLCRQGKALDAIGTLYAQDVVSVEARPMADGSREMTGLEAVTGKTQWWIANHEVHSASVDAPVVSGPYFCVHFVYDITNKPSGKRMILDELGMYRVQDGKISREEFFY